MNEVHDRGFFLFEGFTLYDEVLAEALVDFLQDENAASAVDLGCGNARYAMLIEHHGIPCGAYDGNPNTPEMSNGFGKVLDLTTSFQLGKVYDWVVSLEVAEHIPAQYADVYLDNIDRHNTKGVILSWAKQGQEGIGHVNCKNHDEVMSAFSAMGYEYDSEASSTLRNNATHMWYRNNIMVFRKT